MRLFRQLSLLLVVACSSAVAPDTGSPPVTTEPQGPELLSLSQGSYILAPGREAWLSVSTFIQVSATALEAVTPKVTFESSNSGVASISADSIGLGRIVAHTAGVAAITVRSARDARNVKTATVAVVRAPIGNEAGLVYSAAAKVHPSSSIGDTTIALGPSDLDVTVVIANPTPDTRDIWLAGCGASILIYKTADLSGAPLNHLRRDVECTVPNQHVALAPGAADTLSAEGYRLDISPDTLATGHYYLGAAIDRIRDLYTVPAGPVDIVSPTYGLTFTATTSDSSGNLNVHATMTNTNAQPVRLEYGACAVNLLAYRSADRTGTPVWNAAYRRPYGVPNSVYACPSYLASGTIKPGETLSPRELTTSFRVIDMLADSLPAGHYYFNAAISMNWRTTIVPAGEADVQR